MTKSFKMLTLTAMLNQDALPGRIGIAELTSEFRRIARRSKTLRDDVGENLEDDAQLQSLIENNPIAAWCGGKGTGGRAYFQYNGADFSTDIALPTECREDFQNLVRELVDWRLAEYLDRDDTVTTSDRFVCRVLHANGRPILKLPDRKKTSGRPVWLGRGARQWPAVCRELREGVRQRRSDRP